MSTLFKALFIAATFIILQACDNQPPRTDLDEFVYLHAKDIGTAYPNDDLTYALNGGNPDGWFKLTLRTHVGKPYASLSIYANDLLVADNLDLPRSGSNHLDVLIHLPESKHQKLRFKTRGAKVYIIDLELSRSDTTNTVTFSDISKDADFLTPITFKYGGASIGDIDQDGDYDFILNNHNHVSPQFVENLGTGKVTITDLYPKAQDYHGSALGDYDGDGDLDLMVAFGGSNGTNPSSYNLLQNNNNAFHDISQELGITTPARGRAPRWIDLDLDGDLDLAMFNALTLQHRSPQQLFYRNDGKQGFTQMHIEGLETTNTERVLISDFNNDGLSDFVTFTPYTTLKLWRNDGNFQFTNVSEKYLSEHLQHIEDVIAVTDLDINNDGLTDLYLARGRSHYKLSDKSIDFTPEQHRLDIRDDGEPGKTAIDFTAKGDIELDQMTLVYRMYNDGFPIFLGQHKQRKIIKTKGFMPHQISQEMLDADDHLSISPKDAHGWPGERNENGMYIGYLGNGNWRAEWVRNKILYWTISFSLHGLDTVDHNWEPNNRNLQDVLLLNQGDHFVDASGTWNLPAGGNHVGVTHADFNNDGWEDLFVYRYGFLNGRIDDLLLLNTGNGSLETQQQHGARNLDDPGHGDMGQAFDFDLDGRVDLLSGSEEEGRWYLYQNQTQAVGNYLLLEVGYSPKDQIDPYSAVVTIETESGKHYKKRVGSAGEVFSQSLLNIVHFGLGEDETIKQVTIRWRNGETLTKHQLNANTWYSTKTFI